MAIIIGPTQGLLHFRAGPGKAEKHQYRTIQADLLDFLRRSPSRFRLVREWWIAQVLRRLSESFTAPDIKSKCRAEIRGLAQFQELRLVAPLPAREVLVCDRHIFLIAEFTFIDNERHWQKRIIAPQLDDVAAGLRCIRPVEQPVGGAPHKSFPKRPCCPASLPIVQHPV